MNATEPQVENGCSFCGLPVAHHEKRTEEPLYCCYGCRTAAALTQAGGDEGQARWTMTLLGLSVFFSMNVMVFTMLLWSQPASEDKLSKTWYELGRYACLIFTTPVVFLLGGMLVDDALAELRRGRASQSLLLLTGTIASYAYSCFSLFQGGHVYFETACAILLAVTLGRWLEAQGKLQTTAALRGLSALLPESVRLLTGLGETIVPLNQLRTHDRFRVLAGERIAADGEILEGDSSIDEQAMTGESVPLAKSIGDHVLSGTLVLEGAITVRAAAPAGEGVMARMIEAVRSAAANRSRYQRLAERISDVFLPTVAVIALAVFSVRAADGRLAEGISTALAVVVIACPCALGLATPMALWAALGRAAQSGILIRNGDALSLLASAKTICFDKTGTLTTGRASVECVSFLNASDRYETLLVAAGLAAASNHPLSAAILEFAQRELGEESHCRESEASTVTLRTIATVTAVFTAAGRGLKASVPEIGQEAFLGSRRWLLQNGQSCDFGDSSADDDRTETLLAWGGSVRARFSFRETLRAGASDTIANLRRLGFKTIMLTGDRRRRGEELASELGLEVRSELLPHEKSSVVEQFRTTHGPVAMVGDGVNDAPALAASEIGIALGSGTDISRHTAGVCLLGDDLSRLPWLTALARRTDTVIRWNLLWALLYNTIGIAWAASGTLHPIAAAIAMGLSSLLVVLNSLSLARFPDQLETGANS